VEAASVSDLKNVNIRHLEMLGPCQEALSVKSNVFSVGIITETNGTEQVCVAVIGNHNFAKRRTALAMTADRQALCFTSQRKSLRAEIV
jgi:hypothetical protein